jgi:hypothetical protein
MSQSFPSTLNQRDGSWACIDTSRDLGLMIEAVEPPTSMPPIEFVWPPLS